jgi:hypothetical protein
MGWTVRGSNPGGGEIFRSRPDRPWGPPSLLYDGYRVSFPGVKRPGRGADHPPSSSARVKERVELYLYSPSGPSWSVLGRTLPLCYMCDIPLFLQIITNYNLSVRLCAWISVAPTGRISVKFETRIFYENMSTKSKFD